MKQAKRKLIEISSLTANAFLRVAQKFESIENHQLLLRQIFQFIF